jgi:NADPH-dependent 2,4-dienoyl-CoA reductase/sulfur reductase-like enzyme
MHIIAVGGSDAGISAALRALEVSPGSEVTVVTADAYPNFSICGIPYYVSGEVTHWRDLAHRTRADLEAAGIRLRLDTTARKVDTAAREEVTKATTRLAAEGLATATEEDTACCYAVQDKVWVTAPGGEPWEVYVVKADSGILGGGTTPAPCCPATATSTVSGRRYRACGLRATAARTRT